jgi:hypothetical protein
MHRIVHRRLDPDNNESLLNSKNSKRASQTLENLRRSCNVAGNCALQASRPKPRGEASGLWH